MHFESYYQEVRVLTSIYYTKKEPLAKGVLGPLVLIQAQKLALSLTLTLTLTYTPRILTLYSSSSSSYTSLTSI